MQKEFRLNSPQESPLDILILAAGLGTRMKSRKAKVLHQLDGRPLVAHVGRTAQSLGPRKIYVVVGHQREAVEAAVLAELGPNQATFINQSQQRGTGDAVMVAADVLANAGSTLMILSGDVPLIRTETLRALLDQHREHQNIATILSVRMETPTGYGRVVRAADGCFLRITEEKDTTDQEKEIREINSGIYCFETGKLFSALAQVQPVNRQGEYYLTDVPEILLKEGALVGAYLHGNAREVAGINTRAELAEFENLQRRGTIRRLMLDGGVTFIDPSHAYISSEAQIGRDCVIYPGVQIEGPTVIGENCEVRASTRITNSTVGDNVVIKDHCVIVNSVIGSNCAVGPFAHLRTDNRLEEGSAVGNFVELKNSQLGRRSKSMHLTYLGDATIGEKTNIGAGTVTCNYDGKHKHRTIIEDNVKIGSDTMLVAPVRVGHGSVTGAGSVVTKDIPPDSLVAGVPAVIKKSLSERKDEKEG